MAQDPAYTIAPLSPETWPAFEALVTRHNGIFGGCWCTWFHDGHPSCEGRGETFEGNRAVKKRLVDEGVARAALVMNGDEAIAWAEFGTPTDLPDQEDVLVVPLQRHPSSLRAARLHLRPTQRAEELRHGEDGRAGLRPGWLSE